MTDKVEPEILTFSTPEAWDAWLAKHYEKTEGIWLRFYKKASRKPTVTYDQAVEIALCWGWIDGLVKRYDEESYLQRFTPRRRKSVWSKINVGKVEALIAAGKMQPSGLVQVKAAQADGRWDQAYHASSEAVIPDDFLELVAKNKKAEAFFATLNKSSRYFVYFQLHNAKRPETRERRMQKFIEMFERGEKLY